MPGSEGKESLVGVAAVGGLFALTGSLVYLLQSDTAGVAAIAAVAATVSAIVSALAARWVVAHAGKGAEPENRRHARGLAAEVLVLLAILVVPGPVLVIGLGLRSAVAIGVITIGVVAVLAVITVDVARADGLPVSAVLRRVFTRGL